MAKRKKVKKKRHKVQASMQVLELNNAGSSLEFEIFEAEAKIGRIVLGRGSISWYGRGRHKGKRWGWKRFAKIMDELVYGESG